MEKYILLVHIENNSLFPEQTMQDIVDTVKEVCDLNYSKAVFITSFKELNHE